MNRFYPTCEECKSASLFYSDRRMCKKCRSKYRKDHNAKPETKKLKAAVDSKNRKDPSESVKIKARKTLYHAVRFGEVIKPDTCSNCAEHKKVQGHHEDYSKPLDVVWLCEKCHREYHNNTSS